MQVELDIFSGRPNPSWTLSPAEAEELVARLQTLPRGGSEPQPRLGFRGFLVHRVDSQGRAQLWLRVGGGFVSVIAGDSKGHYRDTAGMEMWLVQLAKQEGFGALLDSARGET